MPVRSRLLWLTAASAAGVLLTRTFCATAYLYSWDSVNFALGLQHIDIAQHQPHPPGYIGYIAIARALRFGSNENVALLRVNYLMAIVAAIVVWSFAERVTGSRRTALVAWVILLSSPLNWFYSCVAEVYVAEMALTLGVAACAWTVIQDGAGRRWPILLALTLGLTAIVKLPAAVLMCPLVLYAVLRMAPASRRAFVAAAALALATVAVVFTAVVGIEQLRRLSVLQFEGTASHSALSTLRGRVLNRSLRDVLYSTFAAIGAGTLLMLPLGERPRRDRTWRIFMGLWILPYLAMCVALHFPKPGYALPLLPPLTLWAARAFGAASLRRIVLAASAIAILNALQFLAVSPWPSAATGGGMRYGQKSPREKLLTELNSIISVSRYSLRRRDHLVEWLLRTVPNACPERGAAVIVGPDAVVTWRHAMFYLPQDVSLGLSPAGDGILIAPEAAGSVSGSGDLEVTAPCSVLVGREFQLVEPAGHDARKMPSSMLYDQQIGWTRGPVTLHVGRGKKLLQIHP